VSQVKRIRWKLTQDEFSTGFQILIGTLRDWEQGRCEPDQPSRAYLTVIASDLKRGKGVGKAVLMATVP